MALDMAFGPTSRDAGGGCSHGTELASFGIMEYTVGTMGVAYIYYSTFGQLLFMITQAHLTGVVLAGGRSSRFGSDKAMEKIRKETFLEHTVALLRPLCAEVIISGNKEQYAVPGCRLVKDEYEDCGPLGGIHAALKSCRTAYALFLTCDMPFMETAPLYQMLGELPASVVGWKSHQEKGGIFPLLVSTDLADEVEQALVTGNHSIRHSLYVQEGARMLEIPNKWTSCFTNINRRDDLKALY